jgi:hypothetical protein
MSPRYLAYNFLAGRSAAKEVILEVLFDLIAAQKRRL